MNSPILDSRVIDGADELAQAVLNAWGLNALTGHAADFTADFKSLANIASAYTVAKQAADSALKAKAFAEKMSSQQSVDYIQLDLLVEQAVADVNSARESLARASKRIFGEERLRIRGDVGRVGRAISQRINDSNGSPDACR